MRNTLTPERPARLCAAVAGVVVAGAALTGCGTSAPAASTTPAPPTPTQTVAVTRTPTLTATPPPTPTPTPTPSGGNGDSTDPHKPATAGGGICGVISAAEVGHVVGGRFTGSAIPGGAGCTFDQANAKAPSVTFVEASYARTSGGMAGAKNDATSSVEGTPEDLTGIGDAAFVVTGTTFGGPYTDGAGAVRVGDRLISVTLDQSTGLSAAKVRSLVISMLKLVAGKA